MVLRVFPCTLTEANAFVTLHHRHHKRARGHRWSIGAMDGCTIPVGYAIVGRPVAPKTDYRHIAEVLRVCTDGTHNACSFLYGATARIAKEMGFRSIQTFTLESEDGASLRAAGWKCVGKSDGKDGWQSRPGRRTDQPIEPKWKWVKEF